MCAGLIKARHQFYNRKKSRKGNQNCSDQDTALKKGAMPNRKDETFKTNPFVQGRSGKYPLARWERKEWSKEKDSAEENNSAS